ncbi:MAG: hypothetical protein IH996_03310 [Proteobacteria bacterium]|nr:hypothetical protein [Pseudomonadota bacterium]
MSKKKTSKQKKEPDPKDQFKDWLKETWERAIEPATDSEVFDPRWVIAERNVKLLINQKKWKKHVAAFEELVPVDEHKNFFIHFDNSEIDHGNFISYRFPCGVSFFRAKFKSKIVSFREAVFAAGGVDFSEADFDAEDVNFREAKFLGSTTKFYSTKFGSSSVSFSKATFGRGSVSFLNSDFGRGDVFFAMAAIECEVFDISFCKFGGRLLFQGDSESPSSRISGELLARGIQFPALTSFSNRAFEKVPNFVGSTFLVPPDLTEVKVAPPRDGRGVVARRVQTIEEKTRCRLLP